MKIGDEVFSLLSTRGIFTVVIETPSFLLFQGFISLDQFILNKYSSYSSLSYAYLTLGNSLSTSNICYKNPNNGEHFHCDLLNASYADSCSYSLLVTLATK